MFSPNAVVHLAQFSHSSLPRPSQLCNIDGIQLKPMPMLPSLIDLLIIRLPIEFSSPYAHKPGSFPPSIQRCSAQQQRSLPTCFSALLFPRKFLFFSTIGWLRNHGLYAQLEFSDKSRFSPLGVTHPHADVYQFLMGF